MVFHLYYSGVHRPNGGNVVTPENDQPTVISNSEAIEAAEDAVRLCNNDSMTNLHHF